MTWTELHDACQHHESNMIVTLAQKFAEEALMVDEHGSTPLHIACWGNPPLEVIQALLSACPHTVCDQDIDGNTPLHIAVSHPDMSAAAVSALIEACPTAASVRNKEGIMPLHMACRNAPMNERVIAVLVEANPGALEVRTKMGNLVKKRNKNKNNRPIDNGHDDSHLHSVCLAGKSNLEATITRYSLGQQVRDGSYPLLMAIQNGTTCPVVETLLHWNHEENLLLQTNKFGETALHLALWNAGDKQKDHGVITMLLQSSHNAYLAQSKEQRHGNLPIHIASMIGSTTMTTVQQLLDLHPDSIFEKNRAGKTPLDLAMEHRRGDEEVVRLLEISEHME